jgi:hypothetical protein
MPRLTRRTWTKRASYRRDPETGEGTWTVEEGGKVLHGRKHFDRFRHAARAQYARRAQGRPKLQGKPSTSRPRGAGRPRARRVSRSTTRSGDSGDNESEPADVGPHRGAV